ncbi:hypothetical protein JCM10212_001909 [Sporobolomyces blumeae]
MSDSPSTSTSPRAPPSNLPPPAAQASHSAVKTAMTQSAAGKETTVLSDPTNFTVKHPLYSPWTLWFDSASKQDKAKSWEEALSKVVSFQSVEEFWGLYNNIIAPSHLSANSNYYLFKEGIKPAWEDEANSQGGKWSVQLPRGKYSGEIDTFWLYTMLAAIGETFETPYTDPSPSTPSGAGAASSPAPLPAAFSNEITGVIVSARKAFYRINIWTRTSQAGDKDRIENIGRHFKYGVLGFDRGVTFSEKDKVSSDVEFVSHKDTPIEPSSRPAKRVKRSTASPPVSDEDPQTSSRPAAPARPSPGTNNRAASRPSAKLRSEKLKGKVVKPVKQVAKFRTEDDEPESDEARNDRARNVGKRYSPGDGQLDYVLTEPEPRRLASSREFVFPDFPRFKPNMSPSEILRQGSFDGGYFKAVKSKKSGRELHEDWNDLPKEWVDGLDLALYLTRPEGSEDSVNKWQPRMGQGYEAWEANGWIVPEHDARGWFQWYYRFWRGRRCEDDERQVGRWDRVAGEQSGRWRRIYLEKYRKARVNFIEPGEEPVSPGIRQTLNHWAFDPTTDALNRFREEKGDLVADEDADQDEDDSGSDRDDDDDDEDEEE